MRRVRKKAMNNTEKLMFASDVHGDAECAELMFRAYDREEAKKLVLLGDLLYHGPRNDLPNGYAPKRVISMLNERKKELLCVRGNCEAEVDGMVLNFPVMAEYAVIYLAGRMCYITHGHKIGEKDAGMLSCGDILINGHTHVHAARELEQGVVYLNPGSVSLPKEGQAKSYMTYCDGVFTIKELDSGEAILSYDINKPKGGN